MKGILKMLEIITDIKYPKLKTNFKFLRRESKISHKY